MVVLFVVLTFAVFIGVDYVLNREKYQAAPEPVSAKPVSSRPFDPVYVDGVTMLPTLKYHPGHAWTSVEGAATARVGLDDFGAKVFGTVEKVAFPAVGRWLRQGERAFTIQREGRAIEVISPVEGEVLQVNSELQQSPDLMHSDPYGRGWVMVVRTPDLTTTLRNLLSGTLAMRWMEDSIERLRAMFAPAAAAMAADAGPLQPGLSSQLNDPQFRSLLKEFFLN